MVKPKNGIKGKRPSFFKVIIPGYSTRHLVINFKSLTTYHVFYFLIVLRVNCCSLLLFSSESFLWVPYVLSMFKSFINCIFTKSYYWSWPFCCLLKRIPPPFLELISNDLSDEATLNSNTCSEWSWNVGVTKTTRSVYFKDGWQEFLKDNSVEDGNFVVFEYEGNMNFNVQIFDNSGCERDCFPNIGTPKISSFSEKKRHPSTPRKSDICCSKCHLPLNSRKDSSGKLNMVRCCYIQILALK